MPDLEPVAQEAIPPTSFIDPVLPPDHSNTRSCAEEAATAKSPHYTTLGDAPLIVHESQPQPLAIAPVVDKSKSSPVQSTEVYHVPDTSSSLPPSECDAVLGVYPVKPLPSRTATDTLAEEPTPVPVDATPISDESSLASSGGTVEAQSIPPTIAPSSQSKPPTGGRKRPRSNGNGKRVDVPPKLPKPDSSAAAPLQSSSELDPTVARPAITTKRGDATVAAPSGQIARMSSSFVHLPAEQARWRPKQGADHRRLRGHRTHPTSTLVLFGCSFERDSDMVRIEALLQADPTVKILSVSLHPAPRDIELASLGILFKFFPERYEHVETNFREERGLKTLSEKIVEVGLPAKGYLDYAWLQTNYYKERPQGYGMNWLPVKTDSSAVWRLGKIAMLFEAGLIAEFVLPVDVGGNAQEMVDAYAHAARGAHGSTAPRLVLDSMTPSQSKREGPSGHPLVCSDKGAARKLGVLARDPDRQMQQFLDPEIAFYRITPWRACSEATSNKNAKAGARAAAAETQTPTSSSSSRKKNGAKTSSPPLVLSSPSPAAGAPGASPPSSSRKQPPWPPPLRSELVTASGTNGKASANDKKHGGGGSSSSGKAVKGGKKNNSSSISREPEVHWSKMTPEELEARWPGWKPKTTKAFFGASNNRIRLQRLRAKAAKAKQEQEEAEQFQQEQQRRLKQQREEEEQRQLELGNSLKRTRYDEEGNVHDEDEEDDDEEEDNDDIVLLLDHETSESLATDAPAHRSSSNDNTNYNGIHLQQQRQYQPPQQTEPMGVEPANQEDQKNAYPHALTNDASSITALDSSKASAAAAASRAPVEGSTGAPRMEGGQGKGARKKAVDLLYCFCRRPDNMGKMVACEGQSCHVEWFHFTCVGLAKEPEGDWYCDDCRRGVSEAQNATAAAAAPTVAALAAVTAVVAVAPAAAPAPGSHFSAAAFLKSVPAIKTSAEAFEISAAAAAIPPVVAAIPGTIATLEAAAAAANASDLSASSARPTADNIAKAEAVIRALVPQCPPFPEGPAVAAATLAPGSAPIQRMGSNYNTAASNSFGRPLSVPGVPFAQSLTPQGNAPALETVTTAASTAPAPAPASETNSALAFSIASMDPAATSIAPPLNHTEESFAFLPQNGSMYDQTNDLGSSTSAGHSPLKGPPVPSLLANHEQQLPPTTFNEHGGRESMNMQNFSNVVDDSCQVGHSLSVPDLATNPASNPNASAPTSSVYPERQGYAAAATAPSPPMQVQQHRPLEAQAHNYQTASLGYSLVNNSSYSSSGGSGAMPSPSAVSTSPLQEFVVPAPYSLVPQSSPYSVPSSVPSPAQLQPHAQAQAPS